MVGVQTPRPSAVPVGWGDPPLAPTHVSDRLNWPSGLAARRYAALPPIDAECRPEAFHRLFVIRPSTPRLRARWAWGGTSLDRRRVGIGSTDPIVCVVPAGQGQRWAWDGGKVDALEVLLSPAPAAGDAAVVPRLAGCIATDDPVAVRIAGVLESLLCEPCPGAAAVAAGLAPTLRSHLSDHYTDGETGGGARGRLSDAQAARAGKFLRDNLGRRVDTRDLAAAVVGRRCSVAHFSRLFKASFGAPPRRHLLAMRVAAARRLLAAEPDLTVADVALRVGFYDHSHLNRHFRRRTGENPRRNGQASVAARGTGTAARVACSLAAVAAAEWLVVACDLA